MSPNNFLGQLPPSYIDTTHMSTWLSDIFDGPYGLPCICSDQTNTSELHVVRPYIVDICQDVNSPSYVHIRFHLGTAVGTWYMDYAQSGFSLDTTDGINGTWHKLRPDIGNPSHNPSLNNLALAGTDGVDASWSFMLYNPSNPSHVTTDACVPNYTTLGIPVHTFVFDMANDHLDTWLSESDVSFRLTFTRRQAATNAPAGCVRINGF